MEFHKIIDGPIEILVAPSEHAKISKAGTFCADIRTTPGQKIYMPATGKIPHVYRDIFDGGIVGGHYFGIDLNPDKKGDRLIKLLLAHVIHNPLAERKPNGGEWIANASGIFLHIGCNDLTVLKRIVNLV